MLQLLWHLWTTAILGPSFIQKRSHILCRDGDSTRDSGSNGSFARRSRAFYVFVHGFQTLGHGPKCAAYALAEYDQWDGIYITLLCRGLWG